MDTAVRSMHSRDLSLGKRPVLLARLKELEADIVRLQSEVADMHPILETMDQSNPKFEQTMYNYRIRNRELSRAHRATRIIQRELKRRKAIQS